MIFRNENETLWEMVSDYLMKFDSVTKVKLLKDSNECELTEIFNAALNREDYEVCGIIKNLLG